MAICKSHQRHRVQGSSNYSKLHVLDDARKFEPTHLHMSWNCLTKDLWRLILGLYVLILYAICFTALITLCANHIHLYISVYTTGTEQVQAMSLPMSLACLLQKGVQT